MILNAVNNISDVFLFMAARMHQQIAHFFIFHGKLIGKERYTHSYIGGANKKLSLRKSVFVYLAKFPWASIALIS